MARTAMSRALFALLIGAAAARDADQAAVTPVQKVVQLMTGMVEKGKEEKHAEKVQFAKYKGFCESTTKEKQNAIKEAEEMIGSLTAEIQEQEAKAAQLGKEIKKLDEDISTWEGELKAATSVRETEAADYVATHKDYGDSIESLEEGIAALKKEQGATPQASSLLQVSRVAVKARIIPEESARLIDSFLARTQSGQDENLAVAEEAPQAAAYEGQSAGIIDMLESMHDKFEDEVSDLEKKEMNAKSSFELLSADLQSQIEQGNMDKTEKEQEMATATQASSDAQADLEQTTGTKNDDSKYLSDLGATCEAKAAAFEERQKLRAEEIVAVEKAIEIMSSGAVAGSADKHLPSLLQISSQRQSALAQLRAAAQNPAQLQVAAYLKGQAVKLNSKILAVLSLHVSDDPFKKVKKMIKDLVVKLMEEANEEAEHKGWCDTEMSTNEQTRKEKQQEVEALTAEIDELEASISKLTEELTELSKAVAALDAAVAKATGIREEEKAKNEATIKDAQDAQTAVASALTVLKDFYEKAGDATALVQEPEIFSDEPYRGMGGASGGVVGMIEVIQSDFARLETDTSAAEEQAQKEYDEFMGDSSTDKAQKSADIDSKTSKKQSKEQKLQEKKTDLDGTSKELSSALEYFEKLKPSCLDAGESFEERVARRKQEIESLQEALKILSGDDIA